MPYLKGELKGQLKTPEIRKLIKAHNVLVSIKIPKGATRNDIIALVEKNGYVIDHNKQALIPKVQMKRKPKVDMKKANEVLPKPKSAEEKAEAKKVRDKKKKEKEDKIKAEGIKQGAAIQRVLAKKKPAPKPKSVSIGTQTEVEKPKDKPKDKPRMTGLQRTDKILKENGFTTLSEFINKKREIYKGDVNEIPLKTRRILADYGNKILKELGSSSSGLTATKDIWQNLIDVENRFTQLADRLKKGEKIKPNVKKLDFKIGDTYLFKVGSFKQKEFQGIASKINDKSVTMIFKWVNDKTIKKAIQKEDIIKRLGGTNYDEDLMERYNGVR